MNLIQLIFNLFQLLTVIIIGSVIVYIITVLIRLKMIIDNNLEHLKSVKKEIIEYDAIVKSKDKCLNKINGDYIYDVKIDIPDIKKILQYDNCNVYNKFNIGETLKVQLIKKLDTDGKLIDTSFKLKCNN